MVYDMHIRCRTLQTYDIACIYKHTISYTLWNHCVVRYRMQCIRHRMLTYDIIKTYDIVHTISYVQQCNIVYTISYIRYGIRHPTPDIRYRMSRHTISQVTYDIVCGKNPDAQSRPGRGKTDSEKVTRRPPIDSSSIACQQNLAKKALHCAKSGGAVYNDHVRAQPMARLKRLDSLEIGKRTLVLTSR